MPKPLSNKTLERKYLSFVKNLLKKARKTRRLPASWRRIGSGIDKVVYANPRYPFVIKIGTSYKWYPDDDIKPKNKNHVLVRPFHTEKGFEVQARVVGRECRRYNCKMGVGDHHERNHYHVGKLSYQFDW